MDRAVRRVGQGAEPALEGGGRVNCRRGNGVELSQEPAGSGRDRGFEGGKAQAARLVKKSTK
jgi:hypothetical protein